MSAYSTFGELRPYQIWDGAVARALVGERLTAAVIDLDPNLHIPEHNHENEQLGFVLKGKVTMVVDGEERQLGVGEGYAIKSNVRHSARTGPEGATVVDIFAPVRADWERAPRLEPSPGRWPS
jgi:quercetin dioxygenase-like cupin family protein